MTLAAVLLQGSQELRASSDTAQLDAELLLCQVLQCSRAYLIAHAERGLTEVEQLLYQKGLARRKLGEPLAYILGHKEFWSLDFQVTPATLIPRPETELLVELALTFFPDQATVRRIADLGTGCGAIALSLSHERPHWEVYATDLSPAALAVAAANAKNLSLNKVQFCQGRWCEALPALLFDAILSNPPYLSESEGQDCQKELCFEPSSALLSGSEGLSDLAEIAQGAKNYLGPGGYLLLEHGSTQAAKVKELLQKEGYTEVSSYLDLAGRERVTGGRFFGGKTGAGTFTSF